MEINRFQRSGAHAHWARIDSPSQFEVHMQRSPFFINFVVVLLIVSATAILAMHFHDANGAAIAAWVQAGSAALAIFGAYQVGSAQSRTALSTVAESQRIALKARAKGHLAVVEAAMSHIIEIEKTLDGLDPESGLWGIYNEIVTQRLVRAITGIPARELGAADGVRAILSLGDQFALLEIALRAVMDGPLNHPQMRKTLEQFDAPGFHEAKQEHLELQKKLLVRNAKDRITHIRKDVSTVRIALSDSNSGL